MFGRRKGKESSANKLAREAKPNELSWASEDAEVEEDLEDLEADDELDDEEVDAEFADDDEPDDEEEVAIAERQLELQRELERQAEEFGLANQSATAVYGSNGEAVADLLDQLEAIDVETAERLADAWLANDPKDIDLVERELSRTHRDGDRYYELAAAESAVTTWLGNRVTAEPEDAQLWRIVAEAARAAVDALVIDEDLDDADYETLYGAWAEVMDAQAEAEPEPEPAPKSATKGAKGAKGAAAATPKGAAAAKKSGKAAKAEEPAEEGEFGPNTGLVRQFFAKLDGLALADLQSLTSAFKEQDRHDLKQAHEEVRRLAKEDETWREQIRGAQELVTEWADRFGSALSPNAAMAGGASAIAVAAADLAGHGAAARKRMEMEQLLAAKREAVPAAVDAVTALVLADLLEPEDGETLFAPWADVIGEPELPEYESEE